MSWTEIKIDERGKITIRSRGGTLTNETGVETSITSDDILRQTNGVLLTRRGDTLTGETEPEPEPEPEPQPEPEPEREPELVTWRLCVRVKSKDTYKDWFHAKWCPSGDIPEHYYPIEAQSQPVETIKQLPEGQQP